MSLGLIKLEFELTGRQFFKLSHLSLPILKSDERIFARVHVPVAKTKRKKKARRKAKKKTYSARAQTSIINTPALKSDLWNSLREKRAGLAKKRRIPAYKVFHDATLREMALKRPSTLEELLEINGIGELKLKKYGKIFLDIIKKDN